MSKRKEHPSDVVPSSSNHMEDVSPEAGSEEPVLKRLRRNVSNLYIMGSSLLSSVANSASSNSDVKVVGLDEEDRRKVTKYITEPNLYFTTKTARFGVERVIVMLHSGVLGSQLQNDPYCKEVPMDDCRDDILEQICRFMYTPPWSGPFKTKVSTYMELVPFAHKYGMAQLLQRCDIVLAKHAEVTGEFFKFADKYHLPKLRAHLVRNFAYGNKKFTDTELKAFKECTQPSLVQLVATQNKAYTQETVIVETVYKMCQQNPRLAFANQLCTKISEMRRASV